MRARPLLLIKSCSDINRALIGSGLEMKYLSRYTFEPPTIYDDIYSIILNCSLSLDYDKYQIMSEYQYYEFQAIDRALSEAEQTYIASLSRRVVLSPNRAVFTYSFGDFPEKLKKILQRYFDAMLYLANWGSKQLIFRLPRSVIGPEMIEPYCLEDTVSAFVTKDHVILDISIFEEDGYGWLEGEGWLHSLALLRQDVLRGDFRVLYLAWLKAISLEQEPLVAEDEFEPPVPPNLQNLSLSLKKFVEFFEIDEDLIAAASAVSPPADNFLEEDAEGLIANLSERERNEFLLKLVKGQPNTDVQLIRRLQELAGNKMKRSIPARRRIVELFTAARERTKHRKEKERQEAEKNRIARLNQLSKKQPQLWDEIVGLIEKKQSKAYDEAVKLILQMQEVAEHLKESDNFGRKINHILERYRNRPGLISRLLQVGLSHQDI